MGAKPQILLVEDNRHAGVLADLVREIARAPEGSHRRVNPGVDSAFGGVDRTVELFADHDLVASVVSRTSIPFGPVLLSRRRYLESIGVIDPDQVTEEIVVIRARR